MSWQTVGHLWSQYNQVREKLDSTKDLDRSLEQEAHHLRDRLLVNYSPLVKYVAGRISARATGAVNREDFTSWGMFGLLNAIETYDLGRETKFETYAISKIRWAILDEMRKEDWVPRRVRSRARKVEDAKNTLHQKLKRAPSDKEISEEAGIDEAEYQDFLRQQAKSQVVSLETQLTGENDTSMESRIADDKFEEPEGFVEKEELRAELTSAIENLDERERLVVALYFYEGLTLKEIGQTLQVTEGRISQILSRTLGKLRGLISSKHLAFGSVV